MSTTAQPPMGRPRYREALERFDELLFESPEVCSRCFAKIRDRTEHDAAAGRLGTGNRPTETLERAGDGTIGQDVETKGAHGAKRVYHSRTFCSRCGATGGHAIGDEILSLQVLRSCCDRIVRRLHERGYYPDLVRLYGTVATLKSQPDYQGRDREILATAVYLALEDGGEAPTQGRPRTGPHPPRPVYLSR